MSVESTGETDFQQSAVPNRIEMLGEEHFTVFALRKTYSGSETAYWERDDLYDALPDKLSLEEVETMTRFVGQRALEAKSLKPKQAEAKLLEWLGKISQWKRDEETATSVLEIKARRENEKQRHGWFGRRR